MKKNVFDKDTVNEQLVLLSNYLESQRSIKKTLLAYLEKVSEYISNTNINEDTETLISCLNDVQEIFDNIKNNIDKLIELKLFIENIAKSSSLTIIDFEKYNNHFTELEKNIKTTNTSYDNFMATLISINLIDFSDIPYTQTDSISETNDVEKSDSNNNTSTPVTLEGIHSLEAFEEMFEKLSNNNFENNEEKETENVTYNSEVFKEITTLEAVPVNKLVDEPVIEESKLEETLTTNIDYSTDETIQNDNSDETIQIDINNESNPTTETTENNVIELENHEKINIAEPQKEILPTESTVTNFSEKTLYIDYKCNIAVLPYSLFDLEEYFSENPEKYSSISDIIEKEYTVSLKNYKNNPISRFKETFNLAKHKNNFTFLEALSYANKLKSENEVEPIIIAACESVHELDCYLECLYNNSISSFNCFNIITN